MPGSPILDIQGPNFNTGLGVGQDYVYLPDVSALTGNNSIAALTTVGLNLKTLIIVSIGDKFSAWKLVAGNADGTDPDNQVQPDDYDATTNDVHWVNTGSFTDGIVGVALTRAAAQNIATGVDTAISFDTARMNTGEWDVNSAPTRFTCVTPGMYAVTGRVSFAANATGYRKLYVNKNGGGYVCADIRPANGSGATVCEVVALVYLKTGDYLELFANQTSGSGLDVQKVADYTPEFAVTWLGNPVAAATNSTSIATASASTAASDTVTQTLDITDVGWYRIYEGTVPAVGGFSLQRLDSADGGEVDLDSAFAVTGAPNTGVIQVSKNVMNDALQGMDAIRVSYAGTTAYVDVHLNLAGTWTLTRPNKTGYVDAPAVVITAGADGSVTYNVKPNITGGTKAVDVPSLQDDGVQYAKRGVANWAAPTGTLARTTFDSDTATLTQVSQRLAALLTDALAFGLIRVGLPSSLIYTDMLNLDSDLVSEGTSVNVTDIFRITAAPDTSIEGIYVPAGTANGHTLYRMQGHESETGTTNCVRFDGGTQWEIYNSVGAVLYRSNAPASPAEPWNTTQWEDTIPVNVTVTTVPPNIAQIFNVLTDTHTAVYVTNDSDDSMDGVYLYSGVTTNGKRAYYQEGGINNRRIEWDSAYWGGTGAWTLTDDVNGDMFFGGLTDTVAYPDEVASWTPEGAGSGDLTATRMDAVDIASGVVISGGTADQNGVYIPQLGIYSNHQTIYRRLDGLRFLNAGGVGWKITDTAGGFNTVYATSDTFGVFPWQASWMTTALIAQEKHVAGPTNWHV